MNVLVIGLGSMGKRRIRLLQRYSNTLKITGVDSNESRCIDCTNQFGIETTETLDEALFSRQYDCAFISTSPLAHADLITICIEHNLHVFTEINLTSQGYDKNIKLAKEKDRVLFLSSTFLYRDETKWISQEVNTTKDPLVYSYHVGQYLPDWHPWEKINDFFVGDKRTNGCREILAIELPWIIDAFGPISIFEAKKDKRSTLNLDYADNYQIFVEHQNGTKGVLMVDLLSRVACRDLEIVGENLFLKWNGQPDGLEQFDKSDGKLKKVQFNSQVEQLHGYANFIVENAYYAEIEAFINTIQKKEKPIYSFEEDKLVLNWIDKIEAGKC